MPIDALSVLFAQLTRDLLAIAKFLFTMLNLRLEVRHFIRYYTCSVTRWWHCSHVGTVCALRAQILWILLSRRSRQREQLSASVLSICLAIAKMQKKCDFLKTEQFRPTVFIINDL